MRVNVICQRIPHHADRSGYDQLFRYLGPPVSALWLRDPFPRRFVWRLAAKFSARSGMDSYWSGSFFAELWAMLNMMARPGEIYHFFYGEGAYRYAGRLTGFRGNRAVCTFHLPPAAFERAVRPKEHIKRLSAIVVLASNQVPYFRSLVGEAKVFRIPYGIDTAFFRPAETSQGAKTCLFVGHWLRDFAAMREVVKLVLARDGGVRFEAVTHPEYAPRLAGLDSVRVRSAVPTAELISLYQTAALLVLPLLDCAANTAVLEAMACGLPIVATDVGGIRDYVHEGCARLVPPGNPAAMADAVLALLGDPAARAAMGRAARAQAETFAWPRVAEQVAAVYEALA